jgi:hypothetical protein
LDISETLSTPPSLADQRPETTFDATTEQLASIRLNEPLRNASFGFPEELTLMWYEAFGARRTTRCERLPLLPADFKQAVVGARLASFSFKKATMEAFVKVIENTLFFSIRPSLKKLEEISLDEEYSKRITMLSFCGLQFASEGELRPTFFMAGSQASWARQAKEWAECKQRGRDQKDFRESDEHVATLSRIFPRFPNLKHIQHLQVHPERSEGY